MFFEMNILFICKHNRFRSKIAEAYFNKLKKEDKNNKIDVQSAGIITGKKVVLNVVEISDKLGFKIINRNSKALTEQLLAWSDIVIVVANNVPPWIFYNGKNKVIHWKIPDTTQNDRKRIEQISKSIINKVDKFYMKVKH